MTIIFDGKDFAKKRELTLTKRVLSLKAKGITPRLVTFLVGSDPASILYVNLKKRAAERIGAELEVINLPQGVSLMQMKRMIALYNQDPRVDGIMIQLPLPADKHKKRKELFEAIEPSKDVDGHRIDSKFLPATVKGILEIIGIAKVSKTQSILVIGSLGEVGKRLLRELELKGYKSVGIDRASRISEFSPKADVVVSATGVKDLVTAELVKEGVIAIDVGAPQGDIEMAVSKKAKFFTPVPGGVGPVTISSLLENLISAAEKEKKAA